MSARRGISVLLLITLVTTSVPIAARPLTARPTLRELLEERHVTQTVVDLELGDSSIVTGSVGRTGSRMFFLLDGTQSMDREISYSDVRAFTDETTGDRFDLQVTGPVTGVRPSLKAWFWIGVGVGVFLLVVYLKTPRI
jgi:hypothetical protein